MSKIREVLDLLRPQKPANTGFGKREKVTAKSNFGEKMTNRKFGLNRNKEHRRVTLSQDVRESNAKQWNRLANEQFKIHRKVIVIKRIDESEGMVSLELALDDKKKLVFKAGQFLTCYFAIPSNASSDRETGQAIKRAYSLSSSPSSGIYTLTIKKLSGGAASEYIHEKLKEGDTFEVSGPSGDFTLQPGHDTRIFIAGGSGITPIKSQIDELLASGCESPIFLLYANRTQHSISFRAHFKTLESKHSNLKVIHMLSQPKGAWKGLRGRLDDASLTSLLKTNPTFSKELKSKFKSTQFYLCGPDGLLEAAQRSLCDLSVPNENVKQERFLAAAHTNTEQSKVTEKIHFVRSGREVDAHPGETILDAGLRAGVPLEYCCQVGGCGHCKVSILSGDVVSDEPNCLSDVELEKGFRLACLSYANSTTEVDA